MPTFMQCRIMGIEVLRGCHNILFWTPSVPLLKRTILVTGVFLSCNNS